MNPTPPIARFSGPGRRPHAFFHVKINASLGSLMIWYHCMFAVWYLTNVSDIIVTISAN